MEKFILDNIYVFLLWSMYCQVNCEQMNYAICNFNLWMFRCSYKCTILIKVWLCFFAFYELHYWPVVRPLINYRITQNKFISVVTFKSFFCYQRVLLSYLNTQTRLAYLQYIKRYYYCSKLNYYYCHMIIIWNRTRST